jgi:hypothetical protein
MSNERNKVISGYRQRAGEFRNLAAITRDPEKKDRLLKVAAGYEQMAQSQEAINLAHERLKWPHFTRPSQTRS